MENVQSSIPEPIKAKPGPKPKAKVDVDALLDHIKRLEALVIEGLTHSGYAGTVREHKFPPFDHVTKSKYK